MEVKEENRDMHLIEWIAELDVRPINDGKTFTFMRVEGKSHNDITFYYWRNSQKNK